MSCALSRAGRSQNPLWATRSPTTGSLLCAGPRGSGGRLTSPPGCHWGKGPGTRQITTRAGFAVCEESLQLSKKMDGLVEK